MEVSKATYIRLPTQPIIACSIKGLDQGTIERLHGDPIIGKPTAKAPHETLGILRLTDHKRRPRSETHGLRADQTHHHPGESFAMAKVEPIGMLA
jgi:hypothetical protein